MKATKFEFDTRPKDSTFFNENFKNAITFTERIKNFQTKRITIDLFISSRSDVFFFDNSLKDIFLTISLRPAEKMIVYNTFISNEDQGFWDTQDIRFVPLKEASKIEMEIKVDESAFEILINQKYIMYFSHRIVPS
ncbi:hypothetical protein L3Y34_003265 [Caenorhabditis briggsae]|uniref:Galectin n=1 Tax=Caenorhabditis briggsae TaxID=6238 RepID=A0AAE9D5L8_CAEBR|nr:hypothetical protein L3Y34_003265 [Caenorhabditis briggsae]